MAKRVDCNQTDIVKALRKIGACVQPIHSIGKGCPDLLVGFRGMNLLLENKMPGGKLTPAEFDWHQSWHSQVKIIQSIDEAIQILNEVIR